jgi:cell division protein FtsI/penicillin-binding protein 2
MPARRSSHQAKLSAFHIPEKANRVLNLILLTILLIILRIWHLAVIQYDEKSEEARKPQRRVVVEAARRATIRDRFNLPLAINKVQYQAAILYSQFRQIPTAEWVKNLDGTRTKRFRRKEYIAGLSKMLADELQLDSERLEDLIHGKASFYYHIPYIIKEDITEKEYYKLKMLEKDWVGLHVQRIPKRTYPKGKIAADVVGYMGAINRQQYETIIQEIKHLETYIAQNEEGEDPELPKGFNDPHEVRRRLKELQERAYTINDYVGKTGVEGRFEEDLRGFQGKKSFYSDARGNFLRELPGSKNPLPGKRVLLSISSELQQFAEELLIQNEQIRETQALNANIAHQFLCNRLPWIKGGAIIAMDPHTGDIVAMASHPRYDPNDFISSGNAELNAQKAANIGRWFETEEYIAQVWDQKRPLERELYANKKGIYDDALPMTWENYLQLILPEANVVRHGIACVHTVKNAVTLQQDVDALIAYSGQENLYWLLNVLYTTEGNKSFGKRMPGNVKQSIEAKLKQYAQQVTPIKKRLDAYFLDIPQNYDKVLLVDLCRMAVTAERFSQELLDKLGRQSLSIYRNASAAMAVVDTTVRVLSKNLFHELDFKTWRQNNEKEFLRLKRVEEKLTLRYAKPYIDYLDEMEQQLFQEFWKKHRWRLLIAFLQGGTADDELQAYVANLNEWQQEIAGGAHQVLPWSQAYHTLHTILAKTTPPLAIQYLQTLRSYHELDRPLLGQYRYLRKSQGQQLEKHLAAAFYPMYGYGYGRSHAYRQATTQGSLFKLITAYAALTQRYQEVGSNGMSMTKLNPLEIIDVIQKHGKETIVGYHLDGKPIPQFYKGGRLPKSHSGSIGKLDILKAIETSSNPYFSLLAGDILHSPDDLCDAARLFGYGSRTGIDLPGEITGQIPTDLKENRNGLYAMAIGQHSLVVTPLQTAVMLSTIANGGKVVKPKIVTMMAGTQRRNVDDKNQITVPPHFAYQDSLALVGIDFPLFTAISSQEQKSSVQRIPTQIRKEIFMPELVRDIFIEGMHRVVAKMQQTQLSSLSRLFHNHPEAISDYLDLKDQLAGKTSTSESMENIDLDILYGTNKYTHVWFGGIAFEEGAGKIQKDQTFLFRDASGHPDLVVVVYLRYGTYGKEAAPVAAQVVKKWREIKKKYGD